MTRDDVINYYGSQTAVAESFGVGKSAVSKWMAHLERRYDVQCMLEVDSEGMLRAAPLARRRQFGEGG